MTKILVIDDEVMLREAIVLGLRAENFEVFEAEDGISGMQLARSVRPAGSEQGLVHVIPGL